MFGVIIGYWDIAAGKFFVFTYGDYFKTLRYEERGKLPFFFKSAVAIGNQADVQTFVISGNAEIIIHIFELLLIFLLLRRSYAF